ncbi:AAA family ATPase [Actinophytocola oryzae]|uniref:DNA-binding NarL/FixJ family response regulator n=1 Tax=Actinophytocola oryzae TaxID=502181 RepID=A0A4R7V3V0_9PSEU|nr:AAA family ATPase [Actinophytocola oryzae]TDV42156.1 DNA-binding NarL/FixJ family response regulator [Actinophytocola oryzae]
MLDEIVAARRPLVLVTGAEGIGKTTLLAQLSDLLLRKGCRVTASRATARGDLLPIRFAPGEHAVRLPAPDQAGAPFGPVQGAADNPELARRVATMIATPNTVLLIDDAQWLDPDSLAVLHALVRGRTRCVCAFRSTPPTPRMAAVLRDLRAADLVDQFRLVPATHRAVAREVTTMLTASPEPALTRRVRELSRGLPAAVRDTVEALLRNGSVQVVDRRAYLVRPGTPVVPPADNQLVEAVRDLGADCWAAAKAMAVLAPLGTEVPTLLAEVLRVEEPDAQALLDRLADAGVVHRGRSWRFVVPLVGAALFACLGPFERRALSAAVVTAVWTNTAVCDDQDYLADRIADAGALVDTERALRELLHRAAAVRDDRPECALRWLAAATELACDQRQRARVLLMHTATCFVLGDHDQCLHGALRLLEDHADQLSPDTTQEVAAMATAALGAAGNREALGEVVAGQGHWAGRSTVTHALACGWLDRWREARDLLRESGWDEGNPTSAMLGGLTATMAELWTGSPERFERSLAGRRDWPLRSSRRHLLDQVDSHVSALLVTGDTHRAERLLAEEGLAAEELPLYCRSMLAAARGDAEAAVDLARRSIACAETRSAGMYASTVSVLVARGELATARQLLDTARATPPTLAHLLDLADAQVDRAFGDDDGASARLRRCVTESGLAVGMDVVWSELVDLALERGDRAEAEQGLAALERLCQTSRATMLTLLARATVDKDHEAARECERLVRERAQPLEQAIVLDRLVRHGGADPRLLAEAYGLLGTLDAVLYRAWSRNVMRDHGVPVPGRKETVAENERLLAMLAAGGLSNKQLAAALRTSDKSVEGRLSRLFVRTGYRSRIELSTAMLNGEYRSASENS